VITKAYMMNWSFSGAPLGRTAVATSRSSGLSLHQRGSLHPPEKHTSITFLFVSTAFSRVIWLLSKHIINSVDLPPKRITSFLWPVKDDQGLKTSGVCTGHGHHIQLQDTSIVSTKSIFMDWMIREVIEIKQQCEQGGLWPLPEPVTETPHLFSQTM
jgi:hypothetical protein